jgi:hypothetical protein
MKNSTDEKGIGLAALIGALLLAMPVSLPAMEGYPRDSWEVFGFYALLLMPPFLAALVVKWVALRFFLFPGLGEQKNPWRRMGRQLGIAVTEMLTYLVIFWLGHAFTNGYANWTQSQTMILFAVIGIPLSCLGHWLLLRRHLNDLRPVVQILQCICLASLLPLSVILWFSCVIH